MQLAAMLADAFGGDDFAPEPEQPFLGRMLGNVGGAVGGFLADQVDYHRERFNQRPFREQQDRIFFDPMRDAAEPIVGPALSALERADRYFWRPFGTAGYAAAAHVPQVQQGLDAYGRLVTGENHRPNTGAMLQQLMQGWQRDDEGGIDFDSTLEGVQDTLNAPPGALGLSEGLFDPLNLVPPALMAKGGRLAGRGLAGAPDVFGAAPDAARFFDDPADARRAADYGVPPTTAGHPRHGVGAAFGEYFDDADELDRVIGQELGAVEEVPESLRGLDVPPENEIRQLVADRDKLSPYEDTISRRGHQITGENFTKFVRHVGDVGQRMGFEGQDLQRFRQVYVQGLNRGMEPYEAIDRASSVVAEVAAAPPKTPPMTMGDGGRQAHRSQESLQTIRQREEVEQRRMIETGDAPLSTLDEHTYQQQREAQMVAGRQMDEQVAQINSFRVNLENQMYPQGIPGPMDTRPAEAVIQAVLDKYGMQIVDDLDTAMRNARNKSDPHFPGDPTDARMGMEAGEAEQLTVAWDLILKHTGRDALAPVEQGGLGLVSAHGDAAQFGERFGQQRQRRGTTGAAQAQQQVQQTGAPDMFADQNLGGDARDVARRRWGPGAASRGQFDPIRNEFDEFAQRFDEMRGTAFSRTTTSR